MKLKFSSCYAMSSSDYFHAREEALPLLHGVRANHMPPPTIALPSLPHLSAPQPLEPVPLGRPGKVFFTKLQEKLQYKLNTGMDEWRWATKQQPRPGTNNLTVSLENALRADPADPVAYLNIMRSLRHNARGYGAAPKLMKATKAILPDIEQGKIRGRRLYWSQLVSAAWGDSISYGITSTKDETPCIVMTDFNRASITTIQLRTNAAIAYNKVMESFGEYLSTSQKNASSVFL